MMTQNPVPPAELPARRPPSIRGFAAALSLFALAGCGAADPSSADPGSELGAVSTPSPAAVLEVDGGRVHVNQAGYPPYGPKVATVAGALGDQSTFVLIDQLGDQGVFTGSTRLVTTLDLQSGDYLSRADFSAFTVPGRYVLRVIVDAARGVFWDSPVFSIGAYPLGGDTPTLNWYTSATGEPQLGTAPQIPLATAAMKYFFYNRTGVSDSGQRHRLNDIVPGYTSKGTDVFWNSDLHARVGSRANGDKTPAFLNWTNHKFNARNYHWDAGDDAFYPVNTAFFDGMLMEMYEHFKTDLVSFGLNIPESNGRSTRAPNPWPDILYEVNYDAEAMASMLPLASDKINITTRNGTPMRLASHKIGMWDGYPWVGSYDPNLDAYCNFVPMSCTDSSNGATCQTACQSDNPTGANSCLKPVHPASSATDKGLPETCWTTGEYCSFAGAQGWYSSHPAPALPTETADSRNWLYGSVAKRGTYGCGLPNPIYASKPSTAATFAVARYLAQLARVTQGYSSAAGNYWTTAKDAYNQAVTVPTVLWKNNAVDRSVSTNTQYTADKLKPFVNDAKPAAASAQKDYNGDGRIDTSDYTTPYGSGPYEDADLTDDQYAAAVQMYLTALSLNDPSLSRYRTDVVSIVQTYSVPGSPTPGFRNLFQTGWVGSFDWASPTTLAQLSLLDAYQDGRLQADADKTILNGMELIKTNLLAYAAFLMAQMDKQGYPSAIPVDTNYGYGWYDGSSSDNSYLPYGTLTKADGRPEFTWGSNKHQAYAGIILLRASEVVPTRAPVAPYYTHASQIMDYLLGDNPLGRSYVTGYGLHPPKYVHHRAALFAAEHLHTDPPIGWMVGGPMSEQSACGYTVGSNAEEATPRFDTKTPWNAASGLNDGLVANKFQKPVLGVTAPYKMRAIAQDTAPAAEKGWCSLEVAGDWNAGLAYFAFALQKRTACSYAGEYCR